jgi:hypothetical protein
VRTRRNYAPPRQASSDAIDLAGARPVGEPVQRVQRGVAGGENLGDAFTHTKLKATNGCASHHVGGGRATAGVTLL